MKYSGVELSEAVLDNYSRYFPHQDLAMITWLNYNLGKVNFKTSLGGQRLSWPVSGGAGSNGSAGVTCDCITLLCLLCFVVSHADFLRGSSLVPASCINVCWKEWLNSFPIVRKYQLELTCRLLENQSALLRSKCWQAKHIRTSSVDNLVRRVLSYLPIQSEREGGVEENLENEPGCSVECDTWPKSLAPDKNS